MVLKALPWQHAATHESIHRKIYLRKHQSTHGNCRGVLCFTKCLEARRKSRRISEGKKRRAGAKQHILDTSYESRVRSPQRRAGTAPIGRRALADAEPFHTARWGSISTRPQQRTSPKYIFRAEICPMPGGPPRRMPGQEFAKRGARSA
jgi:hypothetical protein